MSERLKEKERGKISKKTKSGLKAKPNFGFGLKTEPRPSHGQTRKALPLCQENLF